MSASTGRIRVLVAEDSLTVRTFLLAILAEDGDLEVVGTALDGHEAVRKTRELKPDVVTMDIQMPGCDGFEATRRIMSENPTPIVIVSGHADVNEAAFSMRALQNGALAVLARPSVGTADSLEVSRRRFTSSIKAMAGVKVVRRWHRPDAPPDTGSEISPRPSLGASDVDSTSGFRLVAIAASTGGPPALHRILSTLPKEFPIPMAVVQHIGQGFAAGFVRWLNKSLALEVKLADPGEKLRAGTVYVAPDDRHLGIRVPGRVDVFDGPRRGVFRPSADVLFETAAGAYGRSLLALMLTGMGSDGVEGLRRVRERGGRVVAQDEASSVVFGMPAAAIEAGLADRVLNLDAIAWRLRKLSGSSRPKGITT